MPVKKATRAKATASKKPSAVASTSSKTVARPKSRFGAGPMLVTAMCVTGAVIVIAAHGMAPTTRVAIANEARPDTEVGTVQPKPVSLSTAVNPAPVAAPATETEVANSSAASAAPVTVFGCLERSNDVYRLSDTDGVDAPKSRSWKTAFLKKGSTSLELVDPGNRAHLSGHVGHRVGVTGTLSDRQLQVRSIRKISSSCGN